MKMPRVLVALMFLVSAGALYGQGGVGAILGTVTDNSGATVAKARVQVTNVSTNVTERTETTDAGTYSVPYLKPGVYRVSVEFTGFQKAVVDGITLVVDQQYRVDVLLKPGEVSETVEVTANAVALDTETSSVSQLVSQKQVEQLPLNGRNFLSLLFIGAGAVQTNGEQGQMRQGEGNAISINGSRPTSNNYTLDGLVNTDTALNTPAVILSQDAIQEFKVQSETYSAEYGFSANHQNQFGFVLGGPVVLPKLYNGHDKTFFLVNYEGWRIRNGTNGFFNVPDPAQLSGDFSGSGLQTVLQGCVPSATTFCMPIDPTTGAPFAGNKIDPSRFSRLAQVGLAAKLFPSSNCLPVDCKGNNYLLNTTHGTLRVGVFPVHQGGIFESEYQWFRDDSVRHRCFQRRIGQLADFPYHRLGSQQSEQFSVRPSRSERDSGRQSGACVRRCRDRRDRRISEPAQLRPLISHRRFPGTSRDKLRQPR